MAAKRPSSRRERSSRQHRDIIALNLRCQSPNCRWPKNSASARRKPHPQPEVGRPDVIPAWLSSRLLALPASIRPLLCRVAVASHAKRFSSKSPELGQSAALAEHRLVGPEAPANIWRCRRGRLGLGLGRILWSVASARGATRPSVDAVEHRRRRGVSGIARRHPRAARWAGVAG